MVDKARRRTSSQICVVLTRAEVSALDAMAMRTRDDGALLGASRSRIVRHAIRLGLPLVDAELKTRGL